MTLNKFLNFNLLCTDIPKKPEHSVIPVSTMKLPSASPKAPLPFVRKNKGVVKPQISGNPPTSKVINKAPVAVMTGNQAPISSAVDSAEQSTVFRPYVRKRNRSIAPPSTSDTGKLPEVRSTPSVQVPTKASLKSYPPKQPKPTESLEENAKKDKLSIKVVDAQDVVDRCNDGSDTMIGTISDAEKLVHYRTMNLKLVSYINRLQEEMGQLKWIFSSTLTSE
jgi:hypothetical protein